MKRFLVVLLLLGLVGIGAAAAAWSWYERELRTPFQGYSDSVEIDIPAGTGTLAILNRLRDAGILEDPRIARFYLRLNDSPSLQAGRYLFDSPLTIPQVISKLNEGDVLLRAVTLIEGLDLEESAELLSQQGFGDRETLIELMRDPSLILEIDPEAETLEGYLYPDTYHFPHGTNERTIVATLVETFHRRYRDEVLPRLNPGSGRTVRQLVTLASIVEKEAQLDEERATIAGVYANRLRRNIALYADPTVIFALKLAGRWDGNIRKPDLAIDSPYNTYVYPGLPPGPICSPGVRSLIAAAEPADVPYLYFVSRNDGSHIFANTLREHNQNVNEWQRRYWRDRWAEERAAKSATTN